MKQLLILSALCSLLSAPALAQTKNVTKTISTNGLVENLVVPSGKTLTINAGGSIVNNGTATGFTANAVWGSITGTLSSQIDLQTALDAKLATNTAASTYQPLDGDLTAIAALTTTSFGRDLLTRADAAATRSALGLGTLATQSATISDYLTSATAASTYQPLDSQLTSIAGLADASGVLTNNGSGTMSYTATSTGGNTFGTDAGKIAVYGSLGEFSITSALRIAAGPSVMGIWFNNARLASAAGSNVRTWTLPDVTGTLITTGDTGTVTDTMLAGSIAISKLAITGTPDGTKYLRDDGTWQTISSGATLGANTFTALQTVNLTALGTTPSSGVTLTNTTAAAAGAQQVSPSLTWTGQGWKTNAPAASQTINWRSYVLPVQNVNNPPTSVWKLDFDNGTGSYTQGLTYTPGGSPSLTLGGTGAAGTVSIGVDYNGTNLSFSSNTLALSAGGSQVFRFADQYATNPGITAGSDNGSYQIAISTAATTTARTNANSVGFMRDAAGVIQWGFDASTPTPQTLKAHDGSGTNIDGASLTLSGGTSTGTGDDGDLILRSTMTGSSGSTANSQQTRAQVVARFKNLTEGTATDVVSVALPSGKVTGGTATLTVWASDGTDHQALTSQIRFAAVNKAGTVTATCTQTDGTTAASTGTLTVTCDATTTGDNVILRANATSSLTQTILRSRIVINALNGDDTQVVTPQ